MTKGTSGTRKNLESFCTARSRFLSTTSFQPCDRRTNDNINFLSVYGQLLISLEVIKNKDVKIH